MNIKSSILSLTVFIALAGFVRAQDNKREAFHEAMEACHTETGVKKPERGTHPSDEDRAKIEACLASKGIEKPKHHNPEFKAAMNACFTETGVKKPERGSRPSDEDREKIKTCLSSKGFEKHSAQ